MDRLNASHDDWTFVDLRDALWNPVKRDQRVQFQVDGNDASTWNAVVSQDEFPNVVIRCVNEIEDNFKDGKSVNLQSAACLSGWHRAWTFGKMICICLNRRVDAEGNRMFNAQHFPAQHCFKHETVTGVFDQAYAWVENPWTIAVGGPDRDVTLLHGWEFAQMREDSAKNYAKLIAEIDFRNAHDAAQHVEHIEAGGDGEGVEHDEQEWGEWGEGVEHDEQAWGEWGVGADGGNPCGVYGLPTPPPPPDRSKRLAPTPPLCPPSSKRAKADESSELVTEDLDGLEWGAPFDPSEWSHVLTKCGVSANAQSQLLLLSQTDSNGLRHANNIVAQVLQGKAQKPSSFVHKAVQNARHQMGMDKPIA